MPPNEVGPRDTTPEGTDNTNIIRLQFTARGYADAALYLLACGLLPAPNLDGLRLMWKTGGYSRQAAEIIAQAWELVAA